MSVSTHAVQFEFTAIFRKRTPLTPQIDENRPHQLLTFLVCARQQQRGRDVKARDNVVWVLSEILCCPRRRREIMGSGLYLRFCILDAVLMYFSC